MSNSRLSGLKPDTSVTIDLNLDAGESEEDLRSGREEQLYALVSSVNIACGGHAGTVETMRTAVELAMKYGLAIGAHPSYPDRANFGRQRLSLSNEALQESLIAQIRDLQSVCAETGATLTHIKPHGALYNAAAADAILAGTLAEATLAVAPSCAIVALAGSRMLEICKGRGLRTLAEGFVDRRYNADGSLRSREFPDALISEPMLAAQQALRIAKGEAIQSVDGRSLRIVAQTLCIHGDSENSLPVAKAVRQILAESGVGVRPVVF